MFRLPELPYPADALEPVLSAQTLRTHHDKHHAKYVETTNELLGQAAAHRAGSLEAVIRAAAAGHEHKLFNNAAQAWNHGFFWECMHPDHAPPAGPLEAAIGSAFGGLDKLKTKFVEEGAAHFASGWVWLTARGDALELTSLHDAETPVIQDGVTPILTCDLWEHAYYLDHKNDRAGFLEAWFDRLANWRFAEAQFAAATGRGEGYHYPPSTAQDHVGQAA